MRRTPGPAGTPSVRLRRAFSFVGGREPRVRGRGIARAASTPPAHRAPSARSRSSPREPVDDEAQRLGLALAAPALRLVQRELHVRARALDEDAPHARRAASTAPSASASSASSSSSAPIAARAVTGSPPSSASIVASMPKRFARQRFSSIRRRVNGVHGRAELRTSHEQPDEAAVERRRSRASRRGACTRRRCAVRASDSARPAGSPTTGTLESRAAPPPTSSSHEARRTRPRSRMRPGCRCAATRRTRPAGSSGGPWAPVPERRRRRQREEERQPRHHAVHQRDPVDVVRHRHVHVQPAAGRCAGRRCWKSSIRLR